MSKDTVDRAIKRGSGGADDANYEEVRYEGYGPGGVALIIEALTDNRNRTASDIRTAFSKFGGSLGETNSVSFMFDRIGAVRYGSDVASEDDMLEAAIEAGGDNVESDAEAHEITCAPEQLNAMRDALEQRFGPAQSAKLGWRPQTTAPIADEAADKLFKLLEALDDSDDVQTVIANYEVSDETLLRLTA